MKISELIDDLENWRDEVGDIPVEVFNYAGYMDEAEVIKLAMSWRRDGEIKTLRIES